MSFERTVKDQTELNGVSIKGIVIESYNQDDEIIVARCFVLTEGQELTHVDETFFVILGDKIGGIQASRIITNYSGTTPHI